DFLTRHADERDQGKGDQYAATRPRGSGRVFATAQYEHSEQDDPCDPGEASEQPELGELLPVPVLRVVRRRWATRRHSKLVKKRLERPDTDAKPRKRPNHR